MTSSRDLGATARAIMDANVYMTLGTADEHGDPWVSPVFFAHSAYTQLYWISSPEAAHSHNLARRPRVSVVVFDSGVAPGTGQAVYMAATAARLDGSDLDRALETSPGFTERGGWAVTAEDLRPPAAYRLYRATVSAHWILCLRSSGPCALHGRAFDHRTAVSLSTTR